MFQTNRKTWDVDLDISAPQVILVEHFCDKNALIVVVDLGRFHFSNSVQQNAPTLNKRDSDEEGKKTRNKKSLVA